MLYESRFDLSLWMHDYRVTHWISLNESSFEEHMPYEFPSEYTWPCSAIHLFGPSNQATFVYQKFWRYLLQENIHYLLIDAGLHTNPRNDNVSRI